LTCAPTPLDDFGGFVVATIIVVTVLGAVHRRARATAAGQDVLGQRRPRDRSSRNEAVQQATAIGLLGG
jgi:hypothetical protein